ncbi:MAG: membrane protein insertase YidC [Candidatus Delongbacteria bacterium]|nr:membrane protein insertase YidC [Candidatus Delongbacteria bacterium]
MDKNTKIAFFLIALIIIFYPYFLPKQEKPAQEPQSVEKQQEPDRVKESESFITVEKEKTDEILLSDSKTEYEPKDINIETDLFKAVISTKGGVIKSWKVKNYKSRADTTKILQLIKEGTRNLNSEIRLKNGDVISNVVFLSDKDNIVLTGKDGSADLTLSYLGMENEVVFQKKFRFYSDKYSFDLKIDTTPVFDELESSNAVVLNWPDGIQFTEVSDNGKNINREDYYRETYVHHSAGFRDFDHNDDSETVNGQISWGATRSKYFELFLVSPEKEISTFVNYPAAAPPEEHYTSMGFSVGFDRGNEPVKELLVYFGPMDYEIFKSYGLEFERTMNWGWDIIKPFSLAIYWTLKYLNGFIPNYGLVIIILSLIVNTIVLPFTLKSFKSQAAMKKIQPEMKLIKERYKNDMQKQQQATMELYKKHGVNPLGTCLPTLLPMPILYGMFIVFGATIEFRNAEFIFWIKDLSLPEIMFTLPFSIPFYGANVGLMPIIMGVTMFFQMKQTASADPNQKMMIYFMPVFLTFLFNNLSSGLILYYTVGNFYRIVQQHVMKVK